MKKCLKSVAVFGLVASLLAGCTYAEFKANLGSLSVNIGNFNKQVAEIAPIVGKDLVLLGDTLVQIECSPVMQVATAGVVAAIGITASTNTDATKAVGYLQTNAQLASQLCPVYHGIRASIVAQIGKLPNQNPQLTIPPELVNSQTTVPLGVSGTTPYISVESK